MTDLKSDIKSDGLSLLISYFIILLINNQPSKSSEIDKSDHFVTQQFVKTPGREHEQTYGVTGHKKTTWPGDGRENNQLHLHNFIFKL